MNAALEVADRVFFCRQQSLSGFSRAVRAYKMSGFSRWGSALSALDVFRQEDYYSCVFRAMAVTNRRGENLTDCATNQFLNPEITTGFPAIIAR
jgi:hypothetical protein